jgi:hypothetical protein
MMKLQEKYIQEMLNIVVFKSVICLLFKMLKIKVLYKSFTEVVWLWNINMEQKLLCVWKQNG